MRAGATVQQQSETFWRRRKSGADVPLCQLLQRLSALWKENFGQSRERTNCGNNQCLSSEPLFKLETVQKAISDVTEGDL